MANEQHLKILKQGVNVWNEWRGKNRGMQPDLSDVDLSSTHLRGVNFEDADLENTSFHGSDLSLAMLMDARVCSANLSSANLIRASLHEANLHWRTLWGLILIMPIFQVLICAIQTLRSRPLWVAESMGFPLGI